MDWIGHAAALDFSFLSDIPTTPQKGLELSLNGSDPGKTHHNTLFCLCHNIQTRSNSRNTPPSVKAPSLDFDCALYRVLSLHARHARVEINLPEELPEVRPEAAAQNGVPQSRFSKNLESQKQGTSAWLCLRQIWLGLF